MQCFPPATSEKLLPARQHGGTTSIIRNYDFLIEIKNVKEKKNTQKATGYAAETVK
jgi:hypothetical protein